MRKALLLVLLTAVAVFGFSSVQSQDAYSTAAGRYLAGETVASIAADDLDVALLIKYIGTDPLGKVASTSTANLTFTSGATGTTADTTLECPVSAPLGGVIDVTNAACDTLGEVVDIINASGAWQAVILDGFRTDSSQVLLTAGAASANVIDGLAIYFDTSAQFDLTAALTPWRSIKYYVNSVSGQFYKNPYENWRANVFQINEVSTYGSGTSTIEVWSVDVTQGASGTEVATLLWSEAGGATTAAKAVDFKPYGLIAKQHQKLVVRVNNSAACASAYIRAFGQFWYIGGR